MSAVVGKGHGMSKLERKWILVLPGGDFDAGADPTVFSDIKDAKDYIMDECDADEATIVEVVVTREWQLTSAPKWKETKYER